MTYQLITAVGNAGRDASIKYLKDGTAVTDFSLAVSKVTGRGDTRQERTQWFKITIWRERAETAAQLIKKGAKVLVTGEVSASSYVDKSGVTQVSLEITAGTFQLLSSRAETEGARGNDDDDTDGSSANVPRTNSNGYNRSKAIRDAQDADEIPF
jgi:single-strand DNA-binding protein